MVQAPDWLTEGDRPLLMAIGDSFLNGMRSMSMTNELAALSIPAAVGRALADQPGFAPFVPAQYPRPMLIDVEAELRTHIHSRIPLQAGVELLGSVGRITEGVRRNAFDWAHDFAIGEQNTPDRFDNIAVAGARLPDLFGTTFAQVRDRWSLMQAAMTAKTSPLAWGGTLPESDPYTDDRAYDDQPRPQKGDITALDHGWSVADMHVTANMRHLMNPGERPGLEDFRIVDIVKARKPRILLLDIGPNHGMSDICMGGKGERGAARFRRFATLWPRCAEELAEVEDLGILVVLLPPMPSQVPALMPPQGDDPQAQPAPMDPGTYFGEYVSAMSFGAPIFYTGAMVKDFDAAAQEARTALRVATVKAFADSPTRVVFIDLAELIGRHDLKHGRGTPFRPIDSPFGFDNRCIGDLSSLLASQWKPRGGIGSLDNFHPTTLGYRYVAAEVIRRIRDVEPLWVKRDVDVVVAGDRLLGDPPRPALALLSLLWPHADGLPAGAAIGGAGPALRDIFAFGGLRTR